MRQRYAQGNAIEREDVCEETKCEVCVEKLMTEGKEGVVEVSECVKEKEEAEALAGVKVVDDGKCGAEPPRAGAMRLLALRAGATGRAWPGLACESNDKSISTATLSSIAPPLLTLNLTIY